MKHIGITKYRIILAFFSFILAGCSSIYSINDFSSREKLYEDFNKFAGNKSMKVTLTNDSTFTAPEGSEISNDSLVMINYEQNTQELHIPYKDIKSINGFYDINSNPTYKIFLHDGEEHDVKEIKYLPDSSVTINVEKIRATRSAIPIKKVRQACYNRNWLGAIPGFFAGIPAGIILGISTILPIYTDEGSPPHREYNYISAVLISVPVCVLVGITAGWIVGYTYIYKFNP